jgi:DNA-binding response OmpR family regulator/glycine cleavage system H lipoate-binding protein
MKAASTAPKLLVVDDEPVVCQSCSRILEPEGFKVETIADSKEGLRLASEKDYAAILLDIRIPGMDGMEFLEKLRTKNTKVPVIIITGYSSIPSAAAAMRLGAADYIPKPFTPDEITAAVRRLIPSTPALTSVPAVAAAAPAPAGQLKAWSAKSGAYYFLDESWFQSGQDGTVRVGAFLSRDEAGEAGGVRLPQPGDKVVRGLPLAALVTGGASRCVLFSPVSGEVVEVNQRVADHPAALWEDPCTQGWIARIQPSELDADVAACTTRGVVLANSSELSAFKQRAALAGMGCTVLPATSTEKVLESLRESGSRALVVDAASLQDAGPELVRKVNELFPVVKVVVVGDSSGRWEAVYRGTGILYYAVEPLAQTELVEILRAVFKPAARPVALPPKPSSLPLWVCRIRLTNHKAEQVSLLVDRGVIRERDGLGQRLIRTILDGAYPVTVNLGSNNLTPLQIRREAEECDRVVVLLPQDMGRLPGSVVYDVPSELVDAAGDAAKPKVTAVAIQPPTADSSQMEFDVRTMDALAEHITRLMAPNK